MIVSMEPPREADADQAGESEETDGLSGRRGRLASPKVFNPDHLQDIVGADGQLLEGGVTPEETDLPEVRGRGASTPTKNIFKIGRAAQIGPENQLTEMLAYLWEQRPSLLTAWLHNLSPRLARHSPLRIETQYRYGRRPDMLISKTGEIAILVEFKLGSEEGPRQLFDYVTHLAEGRSESVRALVYVTPRREEWPRGVRAAARRGKVMLRMFRWQDMVSLLASSDGLAHEFLGLLEQERLVMPEPLTTTDFGAWTIGVSTVERLRALLEEARPELIKLAPGYRKSGPQSTNPYYIYRLHSFEQLQFGVGFSPGNATRPSVINTVALNEMIPANERRSAAQSALEHPSGECDYLWWDEWPTRSRPATDVLTASDFKEQTKQVVAFGRESLAAFREIGYLTASPEASNPDHLVLDVVGADGQPLEGGPTREEEDFPGTPSAETTSPTDADLTALVEDFESVSFPDGEEMDVEEAFRKTQAEEERIDRRDE